MKMKRKYPFKEQSKKKRRKVSKKKGEKVKKSRMYKKKKTRTVTTKNLPFLIQKDIMAKLKKDSKVLKIGRLVGQVNTNKQKKKCAELGYTKGLPNISIYNPVGKYKGFHLLIHTDKNRTPVMALKVLSNLYKNGYNIGICKNSTEGLNMIGYYLNKKKHKKLRKIRTGRFKLRDIKKYTSIVSNNKTVVLKKRSRGEYKIHTESINAIKHHYPELILDGQPQGNISIHYTAKGKDLGYTCGIPDLSIWKPYGEYNGLAMEFKYGYNNKSKIQKEICETMEKRMKWCVVEPRSIEEAKQFLFYYTNINYHDKLNT
jgi:hypothetical protein